MIRYFAKRKMRRSLDEEIGRLKETMEADEGYFYKIGVEQQYSLCNNERHYFDVVTVLPARYDATNGKPAPIEPRGWFPPSYDLANFSLQRKTKWGVPYFTITHGRTGNDTIFGKPIAASLTEGGIRGKLLDILDETVTRACDGSGCPRRTWDEDWCVAYSGELLKKRGV